MGLQNHGKGLHLVTEQVGLFHIKLKFLNEAPNFFVTGLSNAT